MFGGGKRCPANDRGSSKDVRSAPEFILKHRTRSDDPIKVTQTWHSVQFIKIFRIFNTSNTQLSKHNTVQTNVKAIFKVSLKTDISLKKKMPI